MRGAGLRWNILYALALAGFLALLLHAPHHFVSADSGHHGEGPCPLCLAAQAGAVLTPPPPVSLDLPPAGVEVAQEQEGRVQSPATLPTDSRGPPDPAV